MKKSLVIILSILFVGLVGYSIYTKVIKEKNKEYVLEKYINTDIVINQNSQMNIKDGITFLVNGNNEIRIYDEEKNDITPKEFKNGKLSINNVTVDDNFFGYIVNNGNNAYYINEEGKTTLNVETSYMYYSDNYLIVDTDEICNINNFNGYEYVNNCQNVYDLSGKLLIDGKKNKYYSISNFYGLIEKEYLVVNKDKTSALIDINNNVIIDFDKHNFTYNKNLNLIVAAKSSELVKLYDVNGNLSKTINLTEESLNKNTMSFGSVLDNTINYYFNDTINLLNKNMELKEYQDVYFIEVPGMDNDGKLFYITNNIYIKDNNEIYTVHDLEGNKIINEEFKYIGDAVSYGVQSIAAPSGYIVLCKNEDKTNCGAIDYSGNILLNFENELYYSEYFNGFKKENQYFDIQEGKVTKKLTCDNFDMYIRNYINDFVVVEKAGISTGIIDLNCNKVTDFKYLNIYEYDNYILAQTKEFYDVYDINGKELNYKNNNNYILERFLGYYDGDLYFGSGNDIIVLK